MGEAVGWTGVVIAIAAMIRGEVAAYNSRRLASEKSEADRQAARDKMEFDLKAKELEFKHEVNEGKIAELLDEIAECKEDRKKLWDKLSASEADRQRMWSELESLKKTKKDRTDFPPVTR